MNIVTVTINPAFDVHCGIESFLPERENHMLSCIRDAGGKGINVARALAAQGMKSDSFVILGRQNADDFESEINKSGINYFPFYVEGRIRENITIHPQNGKETRISFDDFAPGKEAVGEIFENVVNEFQYIADNFPDIKEIVIEDDTFTIDKKCVVDICNLLIQKGLNKRFSWFCNARVNLDYETMEK